MFCFFSTARAQAVESYKFDFGPGKGAGGYKQVVTFTPDQKWIVFRSNMLGPTHVFAVEIAKATESSSR